MEDSELRLPGSPTPKVNMEALRNLHRKLDAELEAELNRLEVEGTEELSPRAVELLDALTFLLNLKSLADEEASTSLSPQPPSEVHPGTSFGGHG